MTGGGSIVAATSPPASLGLAALRTRAWARVDWCGRVGSAVGIEALETRCEVDRPGFQAISTLMQQAADVTAMMGASTSGRLVMERFEPHLESMGRVHDRRAVAG